MHTSGTRLVVLIALILAVSGGGAAVYFLWPRPIAQPVELPLPGSPKYAEYVQAFQVGVAALDTEKQIGVALQELTRAVELIPEEPAGWANLGLVHLRMNNLAEAGKDLKRAQELAKNSGEIEAALGHVAMLQDRVPEAAAHFREAIAKDPRDAVSLYALAEIAGGEGEGSDAAEYQRLLERLVELQPHNLAVLVKRAQVAYRYKDHATLRDTLVRLDRFAPMWKKDSRDRLAAVHQALDKAPADAAVTAATPACSRRCRPSPGRRSGSSCACSRHR